MIKITGKDYGVFGVGETDSLYGEKLKMNPYLLAGMDSRDRNEKVKQWSHENERFLFKEGNCGKS